MQYQRKREAWLVDFTQIIDTTLRTLKPGVSIAFQSASWHSGWAGGVTQEFLSMSDYLAGDFYGNALMYTSICKFLNNATENRPIEFMTSRCVTLSDHTTIKTNEELGFSACAAFAHNGAFVFIDAINPDGTMNEKLYDNMGNLHRALKKYQLELSPDAALLRDVTFLFNFESFINLRANGIHLRDMANGLFPDRLNGSPGAKMMTISKQMIAHHLAYDLSCYKEIDEAISASQLVIVPNQYIIHAEELATLKEFAANGGSLIITGKSGIVDKDGNRLEDFCHAELTGVHLLGETSEDVTYMRPVPVSQSLFGEYDRQYPMSLETSSVLIRADDDATVLSRLTLPYSHSQEIHHFGSAISNPPGIETDYPMMTVRRYGKGRVMYLAVPLEEDRHESQQKVFSNIIRYMLEKPPLIQTNGPSWLEFLVYQDEARKRYIIYAYKVMEIYYRAVARCVEISLRIPEKTGELRNIGTGQSVNYRQQDGRAQWTAEEIDDFAMYTLEMNG